MELKIIKTEIGKPLKIDKNHIPIETLLNYPHLTPDKKQTRKQLTECIKKKNTKWNK